MADRSTSSKVSPAYDSLAKECLHRCDVIASFTETEGQITRRFLTPPSKQVHNRLRSWMEQLGMTVRVDAAGNMIGRRVAENESAPSLLLGSHLDTVPDGGKYDGALGVVVPLAVVQALGTSELPFHLDVIGFSEEEGVRFAQPYLGSRAVTGAFDPAWLDRLDEGGQSMRSAFESFELDPNQLDAAVYAADRVVGYIESHIEQGPMLASASRPLGLVETIAGQSRLLVSFHGQACHAGTTPMHFRHDALVTAARWICHVSQFAKSIEGLRATVGYVDVRPNVRNVIPEHVELSLDVRHRLDGTRDAAVRDLCAEAKELAHTSDVTFAVIDEQTEPATNMDATLLQRLTASVAACGQQPMTMTSGAGHDAVVMSERFPTALLFIRQPSGTSHHPDEDVTQDDVAIAIEVLHHFVLSLAADRRNA